MKVLWNDQVIERDQVKLDIEDRGYQFGDGIYECLRIYDGELFMYEEHYARLERSAKKIGLTLPYSKVDLKANIYRLIASEQFKDGGIYFQLTRGIDAPRNHRVPSYDSVKPVLTGNLFEYHRDADMQQNGITGTVVPDMRWLHCDIKSISLLGNILSLDEANQKGYKDALLVRDGYFTEASASNLWFVFGNTFYTHPDSNLVLPGITKLHLRNLIKQNGLQIKETPVAEKDLAKADEIFISNSIEEVIPVVQVDGQPVGTGKIGKNTAQLQQLYIDSTK